VKIFYIVSEWPKYCNEDPECGDQDFGGDCYGYHVEFEGQTLADYGDDYHDDGGSKCEGFIDGYTFALGIKQFDIEYKQEIMK